MKKGLLVGLSGLMFVGAISCGEEEDNPKLEVPDTVTSASTALAMRITGPFAPNDDAVVAALSQMANERLSFDALLTRGGVPDTIDADPAGTAVEQLQAFLDNDGPLPPEMAVDRCGNPMLASFLTPDMLQHVLTDRDPTELGIWPGVCGDDLDCNTSQQGSFQVSFSLDNNGARDLVVRLNPVPGPTTQPGFTGHLLAYFLTPENTGQHMAATAVYGNVRALTINAFGLVEHARSGVSTRPSLPLPGLPTQTWAFPAGERDLAAADLVVAAEAHGQCAESWAENFAGQVPFGCDQTKALVLDTTSQAGQSLYSATDDGDDQAAVQALAGDLDDVIAAFNHQLKAQLVCPDIAEPSWTRTDLPLGSVEVFQCPDGEIDPCIAYHDMEDFFCEMPAANPPIEPTEVVAAHMLLGDDEIPASAPPVTPGAETVYSVVADDTSGDTGGVQLDTSTGFVSLQASDEPAVLYMEDPGALLAMYDSDGDALAVPAPRTDEHCPGAGQVAFEITGSGQVFLEVDTAGGPVEIVSADVPSYIP